MSSQEELVAPVELWQFLGERPNTPFEPFDAQVDLLTAVKIPWPGAADDGLPYPRIFGINCGRQFGKTTVAEKLIWAGITLPADVFGPPVVRVTADTENHAWKVWEKFVFHIENSHLGALVKSYNRERQLVTLHGGGNAQMISANNPQNLSGDNVSLWVVDEAQDFSLAAYQNMLPSVTMRNGIIAMFGVAENMGPFRDVCWRGRKENRQEYPEYMRLRYPTWMNPYAPKETIETNRRDLPPHRFRQLYEAEWVDEEGQIFANFRQIIDKDLKIFTSPQGYGMTEPPKTGHVYYGGLDLAKMRDWSVYLVSDRDGKLVAWDRFSRMDWTAQEDRIMDLSKSYHHPTTVVDITGVGDPVADQLRRRGMKIVGYKINSNASKRDLIDRLAARIAERSLTLPHIPEMVMEAERFEARPSKTPGSPLITYSAPPGGHDDFVIALALMATVVPRPQKKTPKVARRAEGVWEVL